MPEKETLDHVGFSLYRTSFGISKPSPLCGDNNKIILFLKFEGGKIRYPNVLTVLLCTLILEDPQNVNGVKMRKNQHCYHLNLTSGFIIAMSDVLQPLPIKGWLTSLSNCLPTCALPIPLPFELHPLHSICKTDGSLQCLM